MKKKKLTPNNEVILSIPGNKMYTKEEIGKLLIDCVSELVAPIANTSDKMKVWNEKTINWAKENL